MTNTGRDVLRAWLATTPDPEPIRSSLVVQMRGASYGDRGEVARSVRTHLVEHQQRLAIYEQFMARDYPSPDDLVGQDLDHYLVLRGGLITERGWVDWLTEYLARHEGQQ